MIMVRPSQVARKARRLHERQQNDFRARSLPTCPGCALCLSTKVREAFKVPAKQSLRSQIRQTLKTKNCTFKGNIDILPKDVAYSVASRYINYDSTKRRLAYWTDASCYSLAQCGIGIAYCSSPVTWTQRSWRIRKYAPTYILEAFAISKALEFAWECCHNIGDKGQYPSEVVIWSDCIRALYFFARLRVNLDRLNMIEEGEQWLGPGIIASEELSALKVVVQLRYVPGHSGVVGNTKADQAAKLGAKSSAKGQKPDGLAITHNYTLGVNT